MKAILPSTVNVGQNALNRQETNNWKFDVNVKCHNFCTVKGQVRNLSYENEFHFIHLQIELIFISKVFHFDRFETEAKDNSEMACCFLKTSADHLSHRSKIN